MLMRVRDFAFISIRQSLDMSQGNLPVDSVKATEVAYENSKKELRALSGNCSVEKRRLILEAFNEAGRKHFEIIDRCLDLKDGKDGSTLALRLTEARKAASLITRHFETLIEQTRLCKAPLEDFLPPDGCFSNIKSILSNDPNAVRKYHQDFARLRIPTDGLQLPTTVPSLDWRMFGLGVVGFVVAVIFAVWTFILKEVKEPQIIALLFIFPLATGFFAWTFSGALGANSRSRLLISATGGFAVWLVTYMGLHGIFTAAPEPNPPDPNEGSKTIIDWTSRIDDETLLVERLDVAFRILRELHAGIERDERGVPQCQLFFGSSRPSLDDRGDIRLRIVPKPKGSETPRIIAVILRDRQGYIKLVDINVQTGMPRDTFASDQEKTWIVSDVRATERLKIILFVLPPKNRTLQPNGSSRVDDLLTVEITSAPK
jgi:hypothetical protein